jgi:uncharacterized protein YrrD
MALASGTVAVGTAATQINGASANPLKLHICNNDNTDVIYIGGEAVTTSSGLVLGKLERIYFDLNPGERIYAISTKTGHTLTWISQTF